MNPLGSERRSEDELRANTIATYAVEVIRGTADPEFANFGWVNRHGRREDVTREVLAAVDHYRKQTFRPAP
jgi:CRISPR/Cas system type I-B associated protein Csh2 (Cas7 group RAMP superfamily)